MNLILKLVLKSVSFVLPIVFFPIAMADSLGGAIDKIEEINAMRESLAATVDPSKSLITEMTFKNVCAPVGQAFVSWAQNGEHEAKQVSEKFRNVKNKATASELEVLEKFRSQPDQLFLIYKQKRNDKNGFQIFRRIDVKNSCLHCHGPESKLPDFIKKKYPNDLANNFKPGDLRGAYSVWIKAGSK